jgi:hypothetical protein
MARMSLWLVPLAALLTTTAIAAAALRAVQAARAEARALAERLAELSARLEAAELSAAQAEVRLDAAESVLLDKGVADEEDLEEARRHFEGQTGTAARGRDGTVH